MTRPTDRNFLRRGTRGWGGEGVAELLEQLCGCWLTIMQGAGLLFSTFMSKVATPSKHLHQMCGDGAEGFWGFNGFRDIGWV